MIKLIKIGGSLLKEKNTFNLLKNILDKEFKNNNKIILVVSAIGRNNDPYATDTLKKLGSNLNKLDYDYLLGIGEIISTLISASNLKEYNPKVVRYNELSILATSTAVKSLPPLSKVIKLSNSSTTIKPGTITKLYFFKYSTKL